MSMKKQPVLKDHKSFFATISNKIKNFFTLLKLQPQYLELPGGILIDVERRIVKIPGDFKIHSTGTMTFKSDKHLIFQSGCDPEERPGYVHSIWFNPDMDENGLPIMEKSDKMIEGKIEEPEDKIDDKSGTNTQQGSTGQSTI